MTNFVGGSDGQHWNTTAVLEAWGRRNASREELQLLRVEDRNYYLGLFAPLLGPVGSGDPATAYWWERLLPRETEAANSGTQGGSDAPSSDMVCEAGRSGTRYRSVAGELESLEPIAEGDVLGLWATYSGTCEGRPRRARLRLRCDPAAAQGATGLSHWASRAREGFFVDGQRPDAACEDITVEWRTKTACPLCRDGDYVPVAVGGCDSERHQQITHIASSPCSGGAAAPRDFWTPCNADPLGHTTVVTVVTLVSLVLLCLFGYVLVLRRRYAKYMVLEDEKPNSVAPENIGVATWS